MAKISELGPILGVNTRTEDLFVIVNLIQGDDGTKNITRKELVESIQYEVFSRIEITGGSISNVTMFNSTLTNVTIEDSVYNRGTINNSTLNNIIINTADANNITQRFSTISQSVMTNSTLANVAITDSSFDDGTANNIAITFSSFDDGTMERGTGNNMVFTNSVIDNSTITNSSANNFAITNGTAANIQITNSDFSDGTGNNNVFTNTQLDNPTINNATIEGAVANNLVITNLNLDEVVMTDVTIARGSIDDMDIANSTFAGILSEVFMSNSVIEDTVFRDGVISNTAIDTSTFTSGVITNSSANNLTVTQSTITGSVFNDGTADNLVATNSTQTNSSISDSAFNNGTVDNSVITNSEFKDGTIKAVELSNVEIVDSNLVDFDINLSNKFGEAIDEDSYFVLKNAKTGQTEQMTYKQLNDEIGRTTEKALKVHVAVDGDDKNPGSILKPVRTLARASELAIEKAGGNVNRNDINNAVHISCGPGTYYVDEPVVLPDDCSITSTSGQYATVIQKLPGWEKTNGILVGSGCYVQGFSYMNFEVDNFDQPEGGFAIAYRPGALMRRSPYIRDSTQLSNFNRLDVEPPLNPFNSKGTILDLGQEFYMVPGHSSDAFFEIDDEVTFSSGATGFISYTADINANRQIYVRNLKGNVEVGDILYAQSGGTGTIESIGIDDFPNRLVGRGGGCVLCDRALLDTDSLYTYLLCFGFTPRTQNGTGYVAKNGAGINGIGSLSIFTRQAFFALDGGQVTLNNSGSQFGDISMRARGKTTIVKPEEADQGLLFANSAFADVLESKETEIVQEMVDYLTANTSTGYNGAPGLGYQGYNADKCFRDTGIIVDNIGYDVATKGNYWGRLNGITYQSPISYVVVNEQLTETRGSIEHIKEEVDFIFETANSEVITRANTSIQETLNILENGEAAANPIIFTDTGVGSQTGARETLQDNRDFVIEEFLDWLDNNPDFFAYDSDKCKRDVTDYILPAVKYDTLLDTNYNSVTAGQAYYFNAAKNVIGEQRDETIGAYERLRLSTDALVQSNSAAFAAEAYEKFNEIIQILKREGNKYTPKGATYDAVTGEYVVDFKQAHNLQVGKYVWIMPESITFTCDTNNNLTEIVHPRKSDPTFNRAIPILAATSTTITLNVGTTGYTGVHTFVDALDNSIVELGSTITFSDDDNIPSAKKNARKLLQANKEFIQDYMMAWADEEWFFYDSDKCQRDMKQHIVPAVLRDSLSGTNFNSIQSGIAYRQAIAGVTVDDQLTETIGAINYLKGQSAATVSDSIAVDRVNSGFDEIITIAQNGSKTYTPTDADYLYDTGEMEITIGAHDFQVGDSIKIAPNSMVFSCVTNGGVAVNIAHPRTTDPFYNKPIVIFETTNTTIKVQVGVAKVTKIHTFVSATPNCIVDAGIYDGRFTPKTVAYDPVTGDMTLDIGAHDLPVGKWINIAEESITFSCVNTATLDTVSISHPRPKDPPFKQPLRITGISSTEITVNTGNAGGYSGAHTFVSADADCIDTNAIYWTDAAKIQDFHTPTDIDYTPATGEMIITIANHGMTTDDHIEFKPQSIVFSCVNTATLSTVEISHPRIGEPNYARPFEISGVSTNTITVNAGPIPNGYAGAHTFVSAEEGSVIQLSDGASLEGYNAAKTIQTNKAYLQAEVDAWLRENYFVYNEEKCRRDTGYILDAVARDVVTGSNVNSVFAGLAYRTGNASAQLVIDDQLTQTVGAITWLKGEIANITSGVGQTRSNAAFDEIIDIMTNGALNADARTFGAAYVSEDRLKAQVAMQANKSFLQAEVTAWIAANASGLVYDIADCERDLGYFIDSVSWDLQHNSTASAISNARIYFDNAVSVLAEDEIPVTAEAFKYIGNLVGQIIREENADSITSGQVLNASSDALSPIGGTYDHITGFMTLEMSAAHGLTAGSYVVLEDESITFSCASNGGGNLAHPRPTDPYYNTPIEITEVTATEITMYVGPAFVDAAHTFVSAATDCVKISVDPTVGLEAVTAFKTVGNIIRNNDYYEIPAITEPSCSQGFGFGYTEEVILQYGKIIGSKPKYQQEIIDHIRETYNGLGYEIEKCPRDVGYIVDAISEDLEYGGDSATTHAARYYFEGAVNVLPYYQRKPTRLAWEHLADTLEDVLQNTVIEPTFGARFTPAAGTTYDGSTGIMVAEIGTHTLTTDDYVWFTPQGITFSCDTGSGPTNHASPEAHHKYFNRACPITAVTATTITLQVGAYATPQAHTFVSALTNSISEITGNIVYQDVSGAATTLTTATQGKTLTNVISAVVDDYLVVPDYTGSLDISVGQQTPRALPQANTDLAPAVDPARTFARRSLQKNKKFIQDEVVAYINDEFFTYDAAKCERDVTYILQAVKRDLLTNGNYYGVYTGLAYRTGTLGANKVINDQLAETIAGVEYLRDAVLNLEFTVGTGNTASSYIASQSFDNIINVMKYGESAKPANWPEYSTSKGQSNINAGDALRLNKTFLQEEAIAWIAVNHSSLVYDEAKCRRDVGILVDALISDVRHGSTTAVTDFARLYFENGINVGLPLDQREPTAQLYDRIGDICQQLALKQIVTKSTGNPENQVTTGFNSAGVPEATTFPGLTDIIKDAIIADSRINLPAVVEPTDAGSTATYAWDADAALIEAAIVPLSASINDYLQNKFDYLDYDPIKCARDTGYMVDAISHDIQYGGNSAMWNAANIYFVNATNLLPFDQRAATRKAFTHMADTMEKVIRNEAVPQRVRRNYTPTNAVYTPVDGQLELTIAGHDLKAGNYILLAEEAITFSCNPGSVQISHPRKTDGAFERPLKIIAATTNTVTIGGQNAGGYLGVHTFVSAKPKSVSHIIGNTEKQYKDNVQARRNIAAEAKELATMIANIADDNDPSNLPARVEPFTNWVPKTLTAAKDKIDDAMDSLVESMINFISATYNGISYPKEKCRRDVAILVDAISHDVNYTTNYAMRLAANMYFDNATSVLPFDQRKQTADFYEEMGNLIEQVVQSNEWYEKAFTATGADYDPITGMMSITLGSGHGLEIGDYVKFDENSFTFTCPDGGGNPVSISHPRPTDPVFGKPVKIVVTDATKIGLYVGVGNTDKVHTFTTASTDGLKKVPGYATPQVVSGFTPAGATEGEEVNDLIRIVKEAIERNSLDALPELVEPNTSWVEAEKLVAAELIDDKLDYLADDVTKFIADTYEIIDYSKAKCRRDSGYIIDAMSWDLNYGGNLASRWNADFYYWNNELRIPEDTRVATAQAYRQLGKIVSDIVVGQYPGQKIRPEMGAETQQQQAIDLGNIYFDALFYNTPKALGPTIEPNFEWEENKTFNFAKEILFNNKSRIQREVQRFITSEYKFIDLPKTYRDGGNLINILANDFRFINAATGVEGSDKSTRSFAAALFNIDSQHVFPVFNCPSAFADWRRLRFKGTVTNAVSLPNGSADEPRKKWDAYIITEGNALLNPDSNNYKGEIFYFNGAGWVTTGQQNNVDLLESFYKAWKAMQSYINSNISPNAGHQQMVTELFDQVLIATVLRPNFLAFGSLVESIAHQFNGASAGVNRNALPLNFRNIGAAIGATASVLSEDGGRIRWSGSDELNNQYFARGLRINGRTGRIEGRPFTSSVRKLARRASNSRAVL